MSWYLEVGLLRGDWFSQGHEARAVMMELMLLLEETPESYVRSTRIFSNYKIHFWPPNLGGKGMCVL